MIAAKHEQILFMLATDQTPHKDEIRYWLDFLHQPTPVFLVLKNSESAGYASSVF